MVFAHTGSKFLYQSRAMRVKDDVPLGMHNLVPIPSPTTLSTRSADASFADTNHQQVGRLSFSFQPIQRPLIPTDLRTFLCRPSLALRPAVCNRGLGLLIRMVGGQAFCLAAPWYRAEGLQSIIWIVKVQAMVQSSSTPHVDESSREYHPNLQGVTCTHLGSFWRLLPSGVCK